MIKTASRLTMKIVINVVLENSLSATERGGEATVYRASGIRGVQRAED